MFALRISARRKDSIHDLAGPSKTDRHAGCFAITGWWYPELRKLEQFVVYTEFVRIQATCGPGLDHA
jgi:hypothetical protein